MAKAEPKPESKPESKPQAKPEQKVEPKTEPRFAVASAVSLPARLNRSAGLVEPAATRQDPATTATTGHQHRPQSRCGAGETLAVPVPVACPERHPTRAVLRPVTIPVAIAQPVSPASGASDVEPPAAHAPAPPRRHALSPRSHPCGCRRAGTGRTVTARAVKSVRPAANPRPSRRSVAAGSFK